ncbi:MAG: ureidoglycolate lyase [Pseudomonadota bacterium]|nr:ureidoglycolate lyase [Pseudomonadota bacterium]
MAGVLTPRTLEREAFAPYGWVLGLPFPGSDPAAAFGHPASDFWHAHAFDCGEGGQPVVLWVSYRDGQSPVATLEKHRLTQQALIPLTGELLQFVALGQPDGQPDLGSLAAFRVTPGQGVCMRPGCWHAMRVLNGEVLCAMLTRRSTTIDLARHLAHGAPAQESTIVTIAPHAWRAASP